MGWFSSIVNVVKAVVRVVVKIVIEIVYRAINLLLFWLPIQKKMRIQIMILRDTNGIPTIQENDPTLFIAINNIIQTYKDECDIKVIPYGKPIAQTIKEPAPSSALDVRCDGVGAFSNEFGEAGDYFTGNLAGWNVIPISLGFPITIFVVRTISGGNIGCSLGPLTDYVTVSPIGAVDMYNMSHEIGHSCGLSPFNLHRSNNSNLMYASTPRGSNLTGWQKFLVRGSRHCTFW